MHSREFLTIARVWAGGTKTTLLDDTFRETKYKIRRRRKREWDGHSLPLFSAHPSVGVGSGSSLRQQEVKPAKIFLRAPIKRKRILAGALSISFKKQWNYLYKLPAKAIIENPSEAINSMWWCLLDDVRTFFEQNPEDFAD